MRLAARIRFTFAARDAAARGIAGLQIPLAAYRLPFDIPKRRLPTFKTRTTMLASRERRHPMSFFPGKDPAAGDRFACDALETVVVPR